MLESPENIKWPPARQHCLGVFPSQSFIPSVPCVCISALKGLYSRLFPETAVELGISLFCHEPQLKAKTEQAVTASESLRQSVPGKNTGGLVYTRATDGFTLMSCWLMLSLGMQSLRWLVSAEQALLPSPKNYRYLHRETAAVCTQPLYGQFSTASNFPHAVLDPSIAITGCSCCTVTTYHEPGFLPVQISYHPQARCLGSLPWVKARYQHCNSVNNTQQTNGLIFYFFFCSFFCLQVVDIYILFQWITSQFINQKDSPKLWLITLL